MNRRLSIALALGLAAVPVLAQGGAQIRGHEHFQLAAHEQEDGGKAAATNAPEINAASAGGALTLLFGGLVVLTARRRRDADGAALGSLS